MHRLPHLGGGGGAAVIITCPAHPLVDPTDRAPCLASHPLPPSPPLPLLPPPPPRPLPNPVAGEQVYTRMRVDYLPVYHPSEEEKKDADLYANNVRKAMAAVSGRTLCELRCFGGCSFECVSVYWRRSCVCAALPCTCLCARSPSLVVRPGDLRCRCAVSCGMLSLSTAATVSPRAFPPSLSCFSVCAGTRLRVVVAVPRVCVLLHVAPCCALNFCCLVPAVPPCLRSNYDGLLYTGMLDRRKSLGEYAMQNLISTIETREAMAFSRQHYSAIVNLAQLFKSADTGQCGVLTFR